MKCQSDEMSHYPGEESADIRSFNFHGGVPRRSKKVKKTRNLFGRSPPFVLEDVNKKIAFTAAAEIRFVFTLPQGGVIPQFRGQMRNPLSQKLFA